MGRNILVLKALIAIIFCLIGLQYLSLMQVGPKRHTIGHRSLFTLEWDDEAIELEHGKQDKDERSDYKNHNTHLISESRHNRNGRPIRPLMQTLPYSLVNQKSSFQKYSNSNIHADDKNHLDFNNASINTENEFGSDVGISESESSTDSKVKLCPLIPPGLHGAINVISKPEQVPEMSELEKLFPELELGGRYRPPHCTSRHKVAIIVPFRDREDHLRTFLFNLHTLLPRQQLDYGIYIIEQHGNEPFNRAMLLNVGAAEALKQYNYACFVFHDVDLLPEDDRNIYSCPVQPRHMSVAINNFLYHLPYDDIFGGVSAMTVEHFKKVNGFSNLFWGWGGEDDDMSNRIRINKLYISRYPANIARYKMLKHGHGSANPDRFKYLYTGGKRIKDDGYNSLIYKRVDIALKRLYTKVIVDLPHLKHGGKH